MALEMDVNQAFDQGETEKDGLECDLCKISYSHEQELGDHAWSLMHHINMEKKKKGSTHNCTLCFTTCPNIIEYGKHLNGEKHKRAAEGQRRQKEREAMTFQKEALLNKRVQDDIVLPGQPENEGNMSDPELSRQYKSLRHGKSHQRSLSQPYVKGKGKNRSFKGKGDKFDDRFQSNDMPRFHPRDMNTDFHDHNQNNAFWENDYQTNWEGGGFVQQSDWGFQGGQPNWKGPWWGGNMDSRQDEYYTNYNHRYQTRFSQGNQYDNGKNKQYKGKKQFNRWNRRDNSNERYEGDSNNSYWNDGSESGQYYRNRRDRSWDRSSEKYDNSDRPSRDFPDHTTETQHDPSVESDMAGQKRRCTTDLQNKSKSRKKTVNFENAIHQRKSSIEMDPDSRVTRDIEHPEVRGKKADVVVQDALEPDSTTEEVTVDRKIGKGKKKEKLKKKKGSSGMSIVEDLDVQQGSNVLEQAEQLCRELRNKRQLVKKEREKIERKKKMEKAEEINSQIQNLSKINQSYLRGHIAGCADQIATEPEESVKSSKLMNTSRSRSKKEHDIDDIRKEIESVVDAGKQLMDKKDLEKDSDSGVKSSSSTNESVASKKSSKSTSDKKSNDSDVRINTEVAHSTKSPAKATEHESVYSLKLGTLSPFHQESLSRQSSRASSDMSTDLDPESKKDTLLKMVNSPRSRKERERLAKMLRSYASSQNKLSLPRFNFQISDLTSELDGVATELRLEDLSADVQLQIAELIEADIKPDLNSLENFDFESHISTTVNQELTQDADMEASSVDNVPTRDFVKRKTPQELKKSATELHADIQKLLDSSACKKDKGTNFKKDLSVNVKSEPDWDVEDFNVNNSKSASRSQNKDLRDTIRSMHSLDDSEPISLKGRSEPVKDSSLSVSKPPAELVSLRNSSESTQSRSSAEHLKLRSENKVSQGYSEPSKDSSKPTRLADKDKTSRGKHTQQSKDISSLLQDNSDSVLGGEMSVLSMADLSSSPLPIKQEFTRLEDLMSTSHSGGGSFVSKDSGNSNLTSPTQDTGSVTTVRRQEASQGLETSNISTPGTVSHDKSDPRKVVDQDRFKSGKHDLDVSHDQTGPSKFDLGGSIPQKGYCYQQDFRMVGETHPTVGSGMIDHKAGEGHTDSHKPGMVDHRADGGHTDSHKPGMVDHRADGGHTDSHKPGIVDHRARGGHTDSHKPGMVDHRADGGHTDSHKPGMVDHRAGGGHTDSHKPGMVDPILGHIDNHRPGMVDQGSEARPGSLSSSTGSVFDLVYDLSVEEDSLRQEMSSTESEIMRLTALIQTATEQLSNQRSRHLQLSRKEESIRSRRLHVLREAKSLQNLSTVETPGKPLDRGATSDVGPCRVSAMMGDSSDLNSSRDSNFTRVSPLSSFSHDHRGPSRNDNASDCLVLSDSSDCSVSRRGMDRFPSSHGLAYNQMGGFPSFQGQNCNEFGSNNLPQGQDRREIGSISSAMNSQRTNQRVFQNSLPSQEPIRDNEGFIEPNKNTLKTYETSKDGLRASESNRSRYTSGQEIVRSVLPSRDTVSLDDRDRVVKAQEKIVISASPDLGTLKSVDPDRGALRSTSPDLGNLKSVYPNRGAVRSASPDLGNLRSADPNRVAVTLTSSLKDDDTKNNRDSTESLEPTKDTFESTVGQDEVDQSVSVASSAELKENRFVTLKSLLRSSHQETKPENDISQSETKMLVEDQPGGACSSTSTEFTLPQPMKSKVSETTQPKVNVQYMGQLPGNLLIGQKENMFEKIQSFLKSSRSDQGYRSESSLKSDEIVLDTDSNQESITSNVSLGEKIRQYCQENRPGSTQLDSGSDHTLKGSNSETNTPGRQSKPPVSPSVSDDRNLSPSRKRRKTKKERDQSSKRKQKEEYVINSSSECSGQDEEKTSITDLRQRIQFQDVDKEELDDICMVETGSDDCAVRATEQRRSLLEEVQLDSPNESEESFNQVKSQRFKLGPERLASVRAAVKSTIHRTGKTEEKQLVGPADAVTHIQVAGQSVFVAYQKSNPCRFNLETGVLVGQYDCSPCCVRSLAVVSIDSNFCLYACGPSERLFLFDCETYTILKDMELIYQVQCMHESWGRLYLGTDYGAVIGKDAKTGKTFESFQCCDQSVTCITSGLEGVRKILLVAAYTSPIYVCDAISGLLLRMLEGHTKTVFCMEVFGHLVYSGSGDRKVMEHDLVNNEVSWCYGDSEGLVRGVTTDKHGHVFYGGQDQYIRCHNTQTHDLHCLFYVGKSPMVSNIATYKDKILYGNKDGVVEVLPVEKNPHKCQCGDCSFKFGLKGHLLQHMVSEHLKQKSRLFNCPWNGCTNRLSTYQDSKEAEEHLKGHLE
ncbi:serine-rich adhesin for platelets-like [Argopecten irradians]|uniref:serine-rich adhesin for platelets-like n=1 Tax=Argopecten irradians TaxID=31199 RepID=UPI00371388F4